MENVVLIIHLILAVCLIGVVLLQRSEGGGLGMGGGGGDGVMSGRQAATALAKVTWGLAAAFLITSMTLTILAARNASESSVVDQIGGSSSSSQPAQSPATVPTKSLPSANDLLPPGASDSGSSGTQSTPDTPAVPKSAD
ncbi:preprotein translocase subunit SecG [Acidimangrovimonas sediminis]|uniref:preprotein translocase subunit SecG n=1 Tax=Acidimangrovimonas sediminis TaxID=2056283 RepID=UPI000C8052CA|nr:preprotein translocase subunit SecG [Acidimangrovimonas sediminis]